MLIFPLLELHAIRWLALRLLFPNVFPVGAQNSSTGLLLQNEKVQNSELQEPCLLCNVECNTMLTQLMVKTNYRYANHLQSNLVISPYSVSNMVIARGEVGAITGDTVWTYL